MRCQVCQGSLHNTSANAATWEHSIPLCSKGRPRYEAEKASALRLYEGDGGWSVLAGVLGQLRTGSGDRNNNTDTLTLSDIFRLGTLKLQPGGRKSTARHFFTLIFPFSCLPFFPVDFFSFVQNIRRPLFQNNNALVTICTPEPVLTISAPAPCSRLRVAGHRGQWT